MSYQSLIVLFTVWLTLTIVTGIIPQPNLLEESMGWSLVWDFVLNGHEISKTPRSCCATPPGCMFPLGKLSQCIERAAKTKSWQETRGHERTFWKEVEGRKWNDNPPGKKKLQKSQRLGDTFQGFVSICHFLLIRMLGEDSYLEPETSSLKWLFQFDDSKSLHKNGCFTKHPLKHGCLEFQVYFYLSDGLRPNSQPSQKIWGST